MKSTSKWLILFTVVAGSFVGALNTSIVNVSIPALMRAFGASLHQVEWIITIYMIAFCVTMPVVNWLKERLSYRNLFISSLVVFCFGSFLCGISTSLPMMIFARIIQALGGGALGPLSMAIVTDTFTSKERGKAFGLWGLGVVIGPAIGPTLGGYLSEQFSWRWIFYINIPLGLLAIFLGWRFLDIKKLEVTHKIAFDFKGFVSITLSILSLLYSFTMLENGGLSLPSVSLFLLSLVFGYLFVISEKKTKAPLWDLSLFSNKLFVNCILITLVRSMALFGGVFLLPLLLQGHMGMTETNSGLVMLPGSLILAILMPISGSWADKGETQLMTIAGLILLGLSFIVFVGITPQSSAWMVLVILLMRGIGIGLLVTPLSVLTMSSVKHHQVATASSISNLAQQLGGSIGIALLVLAKSIFIGLATKQGLDSNQADLFSLHWSFVTAGVLVLISVIPALKLKKPVAAA